MILGCVLVTAEFASRDIQRPFISGADLHEILYLGGLPGLETIFGASPQVQEKGYIWYLNDRMHSAGFERLASEFSMGGRRKPKSIFPSGSAKFYINNFYNFIKIYFKLKIYPYIRVLSGIG